MDATVGDLKLPRNQFDIGSVRRDFPILHEQVNGHPLIWLDNAATTQKPQSVIDRISYFYEHENSNIHRAAHELAARATDAYEDARTKVAHFLNASSSKEIVFARGATEAINLVAQAWGRRHINKGDEIVITWIEHHANIVPWQMLCAEKGACLRVAPVDDDGQILLDEYEKLLSPKTRLVSFTQVSNALGTMTPAHQMVQMAHRYGARVLLDGAQAVSHLPIDVQSLDCDFYVFSGHKVFAPTGIGVLYGKPEVLAETPPWQGGGNMIVDVTFEKTTYQPPPGRFEAGTGNIADAVGLGAAIDYLDHIGMPNVARYEHELLVYATREMLRVPGLRIIGTAKEKAGVLSFVLEGFSHRGGRCGAQPRRHCCAFRPSLRPTYAASVRSRDHGPSLAGSLQQLRRHRCHGSGTLPPQTPGRLASRVWLYPRDQSTGAPQPRIFCVVSWVPRTSCGSPRRVAHTRSFPELGAGTDSRISVFARPGLRDLPTLRLLRARPKRTRISCFALLATTTCCGSP